jgi:hypothetical protein
MKAIICVLQKFYKAPPWRYAVLQRQGFVKADRITGILSDVIPMRALPDR